MTDRQINQTILGVYRCKRGGVGDTLKMHRKNIRVDDEPEYECTYNAVTIPSS
jgi:hypothetical protein